MFRVFTKWVVLLSLLGMMPSYAKPTSSSLYTDVEQSVYQIRVISKQTGKKSTIGSGFVVQDNHLLATNYHVVSLFVNNPTAYQLDYLSTSGQTGSLELLAVDVIHDLAVLKADVPLGEPLPIAEQQPPKGADLYSLGNPMDLGFSIIEGTNNGVMKFSDDNNILFSGSLNPGMSGGPTLDEHGTIVGINVATSGNEISFLVPVKYLAAILQRLQLSNYKPDADIQKKIAEQLQANSSVYIQRLLDKKWTTLKIGNFSVTGDIDRSTRCWDQSEKTQSENLMKMYYTTCANDTNIYLDEGLEVGKLSYEYIWLETNQLIPARFYRRYERLNSSSTDSEADKNDVTNFKCYTDFLAVSGQDFKMTVCRRDYLHYPGLSDILVTGALVGHKQQGMLFNLDMTGINFDNGLQLFKRMLESFKWQP